MDNQISSSLAETPLRSAAKTISYRLIIIILDFASIYFFTRSVGVATSFVIVSNIYTTIAYYIHERAWNRIDWGKK
ncbi:MAG: DUF2061 domain-containing protein [Patescibacteria group bacterium]|nr:DUF2061 domain-containing protein [Patescibacteria group bacterium]MCL5261853.1 DUF2061 domain-containing protein [Patescibacteria group bacterium]